MTSLSRLTTALANPRTRTVAPVDPLVITENAAPIGATAIASGTTYDYTSGLIRAVRGKGRATGSSFVVDQVHRDGINPDGTEPWGFEIVYTGRYFEFCLSSQAQRYHVFVDGVLSKASGYTSVANNGAYYYINVDLGSRAALGRRIRIEAEDSKAFGPVRIEAGEALLSPAAVRPCNMLLIGDSFHEPSFPTYTIGGIPTLLGEKLGVDNVIPSAIGGTGFATEAGSLNFAERIDKELTLAPGDDPQIDVILFCASGNDTFSVGNPFATLAEWQAHYTERVNYCLAAAKAAWPGAVIMVMSHAQPSGGALGTEGLFKDAALEAACATHGVRWIPGLPELITASGGYTADPALYHGDGHPNDLGHETIATHMNTLIRAISFITPSSIQELFRDKFPYNSSLNMRLAEFFLAQGADVALVTDNFRDGVPYALFLEDRIALVLSSLGKSTALFQGRKPHAATLAERLEAAFS